MTEDTRQMIEDITKRHAEDIFAIVFDRMAKHFIEQAKLFDGLTASTGGLINALKRLEETVDDD